MIAFAKPDNLIAMPMKPSEWYTPSWFIEAAREVMNGIDLDPASSARANQKVLAKHYYTKEDNGLLHPWYGRVWLNPPYGRNELMKAQGKSTIELFMIKLIDCYTRGDVEQAIFLSTSRTDTRWFQPLWNYLICFVDHKIHFELDRPIDYKHPNGTHMWGTCLIYLGTNEQRFIDVFSEFGPVARRVSKPKERPVTLSLWGDA